MAKSDLSADLVRKLFSYDPSTGELKWLNRKGRINFGKAAGSVHYSGYRSIAILGKRYMAHRLAWLHFYGEWPTIELDHINRKRDDNRISNLRRATKRQNCANTPARGASGVKGVTWHRQHGKWQAALAIGRKSIHLGIFDTIEEAAAARRIAAVAYQGEFAHEAKS